MPPPAPVILAVNHSHSLDFLPLRWLLYGRGQQVVTWVKPRAYLDRTVAWYLRRTGNVPVASRGYVIAADFVRRYRRRPSEAEYQALRDHVEGRAGFPDDPALDPLVTEPRDLLGLRFDPAQQTYRAAIHQVFERMMHQTVRLSAIALHRGRHLHIYPQGTVADRLTPARAGVVQAAMALGRPIVPVGISGVREALAGAGATRAIVVRFGAPIALPRPAGFVPFSRRSEQRHTRALAAAADHLTQAIDGLLDPGYRLVRDRPLRRAQVARFV
jgi:1-acyl-sn-glycerol-3-phosphate acyltransferase